MSSSAALALALLFFTGPVVGGVKYASMFREGAVGVKSAVATERLRVEADELGGLVDADRFRAVDGGVAIPPTARKRGSISGRCVGCFSTFLVVTHFSGSGLRGSFEDILFV